MAEVLLVANYRPDQQHGMLRLAEILESGLRANAIDVEVIRPEPFFGRWARKWLMLNKWLRYLDKFVLFPPRLRKHARNSLLIHIVDHSNALYCLWLKQEKAVVTCNDLLAVRSARGEFREHQTGAAGKLLQILVLKGLQRAAHLICISESTRADVLRLTRRPESRVSRIYLGLAPIFQSAVRKSPPAPVSAEAETAAQLDLRAGRYLLHVGGNTWYKNRSGVLMIYQAIRNRLGNESPDLFMVGPALATEIEGVRFIPFIPDADLAELYRKAELLLFPSLYEGFGWPIVEAQACGCPTVITDIPPLTEAGGKAAARITNPSDIEAAAHQVIRVLKEDAKVRAERIAAGRRQAGTFSDEQMIASYLELYASTLRR